jgi:nitric oxide reductase NorQ protein
MERAIEEYVVTDEPFYLAVAREVELFEAAHAARLPVMLKGPTGCGKTRFVEHMAWRLGRPLITVACHEDLSATDLVGRFLLEGEETVWHDGPLTTAVRNGAICYLDEVVEARKDTVVIIHPLTDDRRRLPIEKRGTILDAPPDFMLVVSYNPGYQSILKDLKQSTRQRFVSLEFDYPPPELEAEVVAREGAISGETARDLVLIGQKVRNLRGHGLEEGVSTRLLIYAAQLIARGIHPRPRRRRSRPLLPHHRRPRPPTQHPRNRDHRDLNFYDGASGVCPLKEVMDVNSTRRGLPQILPKAHGRVAGEAYVHGRARRPVA